MRIGRVVSSAPRRPNSPSPGIQLCTPSDPPHTLKPPVSKEHVWVWQLNLKARDLALCLVRPKLTRGLIVACVGMLGSCSFQRNRGIRVWTEFQLNKVDIPVLRRDLGRIMVGLSAWDRAHKESIRAALVAGRGASAESLITAGIHWYGIPIRDEPNLPLLKAFTQRLRPSWYLLVCIPLMVVFEHLRTV
eukprot:420444-Pelagomonas_calceolata.AAC.1